MTRVFADAGYWIALLNARDGLHAKARDVSADLGNPRIVTSELVLMEVFNALAGKGEFLRRAAGALFDRIRLHPDAEIVPMNSNAFRDAVALYRARGDKTWGLTDCTSFLIMRQRGITVALSGDREFQQAGFEALLVG